MMTKENRCSLCGDLYHADPDEQDWQGLFCPGANATDDVKEQFRFALAKKWAEVWEAESRLFFEWEDGREKRNQVWDQRQRSDVTLQQLRDDCNKRTDSELDRQRKEEILQPYGGFDVDIPHVTVPGKMPNRGSIVRNVGELTKSDDVIMYLPENEDL